MTAHHNLSHWLQTAPAFASESVELPKQVEIVILGAGIMGCSLAYWLTRQGQRPLIIERNVHPAGGATGRNGGLMVAGPSQPYQRAIQRLGHAQARDVMRATLLNRELLDEVLKREAIEAAYTRPGFLTIGADADEAAQLQATVRALKADGFGGDWLERAEAEKQLGTTLGQHYVGAVFAPGDGQLHSARYTFGVAEAARRAGALFAFSTAAQVVEPGRGGQGWRIRTTRGAVTTARLVITLNAWAGELFPLLRPFISPTRGHVILTAPVSFQLTPWVANAGWDYGRQLEDGRLLIGGQRVSRPDREKGHAPPAGENVPSVEPEVVEALTRITPKLFPALAGVPIVHHWTGAMAFTPDEQPLVGQWPGQPAVWLMVGFSGHGMPFSQVLPYAVAAHLVGADGPALPTAFDPARFLSAALSVRIRE